MRRLFTFVVVAIVTASCAKTVNVEQEKAALMAADKEWSQSTKDPAKFVGMMATDGSVLMHAAPRLTGTNALTQAYTQLSGAPGFALTWTADRAAVSASGDLGYTAGSSSMTMTNAAGTPSVEKGKYVTVWTKVNGAWKVLEDISNADAPTAVSSAAVAMPAASIKWMDAPPFLNPGAKLAVISGDPSKPEPFTIRLQMPNGYKIAPHTHPTDEHVTVMSGTFAAAMGKTWDDKALGDFAAGSYANMAATMPHYAQAKGATVVQVHGVGPFVVDYVNPADDPSKKK
jgi:ketosteroid isomerase-like protein